MRRWLIWFVAMCSSTIVAAGCVPTPPAPAPQLPAGIGVRWVRDTGGSVDPDSGLYTPAYDRYQVLGGVVAGPTPAGPYPDPFPPFADTIPLSAAPHRPDGTARFPSNGFAGEGIAMSGANAPFTFTFPSGSCIRDTEGVRNVYPSPDGTKAALYVLDTFADETEVSIVSLADGGECDEISREFNAPIGDWPGENIGAPVVWSPDSDAVVYPTFHDDGTGGTTTILHRLDATPGATPTAVGTPAPEGTRVVPLGWSVADRLLTSTYEAAAHPGPIATLATMQLSGGGRRVIERKDLTGIQTTYSLFPAALLQYGYFVPGTTTVVFNSISKIVTNPTGQRFPWVRTRRIADTAGAASAPLTGSDPPLSWHQEALSGPTEPPFTLVDVPNGEIVERFVH